MESKFTLHFLLYFIIYTVPVAVFSQVASDPCPELTITARITPACEGLNNGQISINVSKGLPPYRVRWDDGSTRPYKKRLDAGTYRVQVTDALGCRANANFQVANYAALQASLEVTHTSKSGKRNGAIHARVVGGQPPYRYSWVSSTLGVMSAVDSDRTSWEKLPEGIYKLVVFDNAGCYYEVETQVR